MCTPSLERSVPKPLKVPSLARPVPKPLKVKIHKYPSRVHPSGAPERSEASIDGWWMVDGGWWWMVDGGWWMVVDGRKKSSRILLKICSDEVQGILMCGNLENLRKTFFIGKKIQLQLSKSGGFLVEKKVL